MVVPFHPSVVTKRKQRFISEFFGDAVCLVKAGDTVVPSTVVFEGRTSEILQAINIGKELGVPSAEAKKYINKTDGEIIDKGDVVASRTVAMGTVERVIRSRYDGRVSLSRISSGVLDVRAPFSDASVSAGVHGRVARVFPGHDVMRKLEFEVEGYTVSPFECVGHGVSGFFYILKGGTSVYRASDVDNRCMGKIVIAGRSLSVSLYEALIESGAKGVVVGGMPLTEFRMLESVAVPIFVIEGWGIIPINTVLMSLLKDLGEGSCFLDVKGKQMLICPLDEPPEVEDEGDEGMYALRKLEKGSTVQVWDLPYWGYTGTVQQVLEEEDLVQVLFPSSEKVVVNSRSVVSIGEV